MTHSCLIIHRPTCTPQAYNLRGESPIKTCVRVEIALCARIEVSDKPLIESPDAQERPTSCTQVLSIFTDFSSDMSSTHGTSLKPPRFDLSDDEGYQSIMEQTLAEAGMDVDSGSSSKKSKYALLNKACSFLQSPPASLSLKPLATLTEVDQQFLHILAWNVRILDADAVSRFDAVDRYKINTRHHDQADYLHFLWSYMASVNQPIPGSQEVIHPAAVAEAVITYLQNQVRERAETARKRAWESITAMQSDLETLMTTLRQAEGLALLEPDKPQLAY